MKLFYFEFLNKILHHATFKNVSASIFGNVVALNDYLDFWRTTSVASAVKLYSAIAYGSAMLCCSDVLPP